MKKLFKFISVALFAVLSMIVISSCSSDNEEPSIAFDKSTVVGTWEIINAGTTSWRWIAEGNVLTFNSDGSCKTGFPMEDPYKIESGVIKTYYKSTGEPMLIYVLSSVNSDVYTVKVNGTLDESNKSVTIQMKKK